MKDTEIKEISTYDTINRYRHESAKESTYRDENLF